MKLLKSYLRELVEEFNLKRPTILSNPKISYIYKTGDFPSKGSLRNSKSYSIVQGYCFQINILQQHLSYEITEFDSTKKIYNHIVKNNLWYRSFEDYNENTRSFPSINSGISAGFLARNFEITGEFNITERSFEIAFQELISFLRRDYVLFEHYVNLVGVTGDIPEIKVTKDISIVKADHELAKTFCLYYNSTSPIRLEMFEGDYTMKVAFKIPKKYFDYRAKGRDPETFPSKLIRNKMEKWKNLAILSLSGYVDVGKEIVISKDWPMMQNSPVGPYDSDRSFISIKDSLSVTKDIVPELITIGKVLSKADFGNLDKQVNYSLERLRKAKSSNNIDDKVVELALALEYLIETHNAEVTLQLCLKATKLMIDFNKDEKIPLEIKKFYDLRSTIIHGRDKLKGTTTEIDLLERIESFIRKSIIRFIQLNQKHSYTDINKALKSSMYVSKKLSHLLNGQ